MTAEASGIGAFEITLEEPAVAAAAAVAGGTY